MSERTPTVGEFHNFIDGLVAGRRSAIDAERERIIAILEDKCECTEWMCAGAWSPEGQTVWCKWHMLIKEIEED